MGAPIGKGAWAKGFGKGYQGASWRCGKVGHKAAECTTNIDLMNARRGEDGGCAEGL